MTHQRHPIARLPVFGWASLRGGQPEALDSLLALPNMHYSTSGRASILLALESLRVGRGDRVLVPTYHCPTMVAPAVECGAVPMFYPIDAQGAPDLTWLSAQDLRNARVILVAHFFGLPQPMASVRRWCDDKGIALLEDCAHSLFGRSGDRYIGAWGDVAIGSLTKFLPLPEGGCIVMNNGTALPALTPCGVKEDVKAAVDILEVGALHGRITGLNAILSRPLAAMRRLRAEPPTAAAAPVSSQEEKFDGFSIDSTLAHRSLSAPCRLLAEKLPRARIVELRRRRYQQLANRLSGQTGLRPLMPSLPPNCAPYVFPLWVDQPDPGYAELRRLHIPTFRWDRLWPGVPSLEGDHGLSWSHHVLQVACHQDLTDSEFETLAHSLLRLYSAMPGAAAPSRDRGPLSFNTL